MLFPDINFGIVVTLKLRGVEDGYVKLVNDKISTNLKTIF